MKLILQYMTSPRCRAILLAELEKIGLTYSIAELEKDDITEIGPAQKYAILITVLEKSMVTRAEENHSLLVDRMKDLVNEAIHSEEIHDSKFSDHISKKLHYNYNYLSNLFSHEHGCTLKHYIIDQKIQRVKELLLNGHHTLSEIAWMLHYSSVAHLSNQFKKVTGCRPSHFKMTQADQGEFYRLVKRRPMEYLSLPRQHPHAGAIAHSM